MALIATREATPSVASTSNAATYTSSAFTFVSGRLYIYAIAFSDAEATAELPTSLTTSAGGTGITWTRVTPSASYDTTGTPLRRLTLWWGIGDGTSHTVTLTQPDAGTGCHMYCVSVTPDAEVDESSPIVQSAANQGNTPGTTASCTLSTFGSESNLGLIFATTDVNVAISADTGGGWTELNSGTDVSYTNPPAYMSGAYLVGTDTSPSMTLAGGADWGAIAVEVRAAALSPITGTGAATAGALQASGTGTVAIVGTGAALSGALQASATGTVAWVPVTGTGAATSGALVASATGTVAITGSGAAAASPLLAAGTGTVAIVGTGAATSGALVAAGTGTVGALSPITGTGALTAGALQASGTGAVAVSGTGAAAASALLASGTGTVRIAGTGAATASPLLASGTGTVAITGTGAATSTPTVAGTGRVAISGSGAATSGALRVDGQGAIGDVTSGVGAATSPPFTASGTGTVLVSGVGAATSTPVVSGTGTVESPAITGVGAATMVPVVAGTGTVAIVGVGALTAPAFLVAGVMEHEGLSEDYYGIEGDWDHTPELVGASGRSSASGASGRATSTGASGIVTMEGQTQRVEV